MSLAPGVNGLPFGGQGTDDFFAASQSSMFQRVPSAGQQQQPGDWAEDYSNEPPLLEELGINFEHIIKKVKAVFMLQRDIDPNLMRDTDMAGPLLFCLALGFCLLLTGKIHFGYIYGFGAMGCLAMYVVVNLMAHTTSLDLYRTFSVMGYCLLPIVVLSATAVLVDMRGFFGIAAAGIAVSLCTLSSARFFDAAVGMREQKWLIAYPAFLLYACFALITVF